jgi:hypothetical protein
MPTNTATATPAATGTPLSLPVGGVTELQFADSDSSQLSTGNRSSAEDRAPVVAVVLVGFVVIAAGAWYVRQRLRP